MKKWVVREVYNPGANVLNDFNSILDLLLQNRGIDENLRQEFLNPLHISEYLKKLRSDFKESLKQARDEITNAINQSRPIIIHGDYDADGICATAILYKTLTETLGYKKVAYFIPNRFDQGYGLSADSVKEMGDLVNGRFGLIDDIDNKAGKRVVLHKNKSNEPTALIITVDCGITAEEAVLQQARDLGFKIIITDHHQKQESLPQSDVLLWNDQMVGASAALMLALVLGLRDEQLLCLAGIATVTDLIPLKGFNRALVKKSLAILNTNPPLGIKTLIDVAGRSNGELGVYDLGYIIGPRLNASGRLDSAYESLKLLLENDKKEVAQIAQKLNAVNLERQEMTQKMYDLAERLYIEDAGRNKQKIIIVVSENFHEGVIGLVAGKLAQKYAKPTIAISINGEMAKGSVRSVAGVNIIEFLRHFGDRFTSLGGHPMAAGFSVKKVDLTKLTEDLYNYAQETISDDVLVPQLTVDLELPIAQISSDLLKQVDQLKPYGIGNPEPLFLSRKVGVAGCDFVGKEGSHLSLKLFDGQTTYKAVMFDAKNLGISGFNLGDKLDIVYTASLKDYNGKTYTDLVIKDFAISLQG